MTPTSRWPGGFSKICGGSSKDDTVFWFRIGSLGRAEKPSQLFRNAAKRSASGGARVPVPMKSRQIAIRLMLLLGCRSVEPFLDSDVGCSTVLHQAP